MIEAIGVTTVKGLNMVGEKAYIGISERSELSVEVGQVSVLANTLCTMDLHCPINNLERHSRNSKLYHQHLLIKNTNKETYLGNSNILHGLLSAVQINLSCSSKNQKSSLINLRSRVCDIGKYSSVFVE